MSKIVRAVNAIIAHPEEIKDVIANGDELYFKFAGKHVWSIIKRKDDTDTRLFLYPDTKNTDVLAHLQEEDFDNINLVMYHTKEINTIEARDSFSELYNVVKEKLFGVDDVLDSIIKDYEPF